MASKIEKTEDIEVVLKRFGDQQSSLLDQFERLSFEVQLNQAILGRSLSEPSAARPPLRAPPPAPPHLVAQVRQGRRGSGFNRVLKKLLKPILGRKGGGGKKQVPEPKNSMPWKAFARSKSVRI